MSVVEQHDKSHSNFVSVLSCTGSEKLKTDFLKICLQFFARERHLEMNFGREELKTHFIRICQVNDP
jgi:hypothetical protein